jgi:tetratricopeptide (TPR) repeat protein
MSSKYGRLYYQRLISLLISQHELGRAYLEDGHITKALQLLEHVVNIRKTALAENEPNLLGSEFVLVRTYYADGQKQEALTLLKYVVKIACSIYEKDHPNLVFSEELLAEWPQEIGSGSNV